jgi:hypothetical protein
MATFNEVAAFKSVLQRKALVGTVLVADMATAAIADLVDGTGALVALTGYESLGKFTTDGISLGNDVERQQQRGWGDAYPSRIDVTGESATLGFTAMESSRPVWDAFYNVELPTTATTANSIVFDKPPLPEIRDKRVLALARDINKSNGLDIYIGVLFPKGNLSQNGEQSFNNDEGGLVYPMQAQALLDDTEGTATRLLWGGPGLAGLLEDMGFVVATAWAASTAYAVGDRVRLSGGEVLEATVAGTSGTTEPTAPAVGGTVTDGTVTWQRIS